MAVLVTVVVQDDQLVPQPVEDVAVWFYTAGEVLITSAQTDANGEIELMLDGAVSPGTQYIIRLRKDGYSFAEGPTQTIYVLEPVVPPATNIFDIEAHQFTLPESSNPNLCKLSGYLTDSACQPLASRIVRFVQRRGFPDDRLGGMHFPGDPSVVGRNFLIADAVFETDEEGYLECSLPRGGRFDVHIDGVENPSGVIAPVIIPDAAGWKLEDVLFIYPVSVTYDEASLSLALGETATLGVEMLLSNGYTVSTAQDLEIRLTFSSSDTDICSVVVSGDGELLVTGLGVGSATLEVERADGTTVPALPAVGDLEVTAPTIEVI